MSSSDGYSLGIDQIKKVFATRGFVFNDKNELLVVSKDSENWFLPGGWVEPLELSKFACQREIEEETGLIVEVEKVIFIEEAIVDNLDKFNNICHRLDLFMVCSCKDANLSGLEVEDEDVKHCKFIAEKEWLESFSIAAPLPLKNLGFNDIKEMRDCYSWRGSFETKFIDFLVPDQNINTEDKECAEDEDDIIVEVKKYD